MKEIRAHKLFQINSPDEVAECFEGIGTELYAKIWNTIVPLYDKKPRSEVPDDFGRRNLSKFWKHFTDDEKRQLNEIAKRKQAETNAWMKEHGICQPKRKAKLVEDDGQGPREDYSMPSGELEPDM